MGLVTLLILIRTLAGGFLTLFSFLPNVVSKNWVSLKRSKGFLGSYWGPQVLEIPNGVAQQAHAGRFCPGAPRSAKCGVSVGKMIRGNSSEYTKPQGPMRENDNETMTTFRIIQDGTRLLLYDPTLVFPSTAALSNSRGTRGFWGCLLGLVKAWLENTHMELANTSVPSVDGFRERKPQRFGVMAVNHR